MKRTTALFAVLLFSAVALLLGCGSDDDSGIKATDCWPLTVGNKWTYTENTKATSEFTREVTGTQSLTIAGVNTTIVKEVYANGDISTYNVTVDKNGLTIYKGLEEVTLNGAPYWYQYNFNPPCKMMPGEMSEGEKYTYECTFEVTSNYPNSDVTATMSEEITFEGYEDVTVAAGIFDGAKFLSKDLAMETASVRAPMFFTKKGRQAETPPTDTTWYAKGVGEVKVLYGVDDSTDELKSATVDGVNYP